LVGKKLVEPKRSGRYPRCIEQGIEVDGDPGFPWQRDKEGDKGLEGVFGHFRHGLQYGREGVQRLKGVFGHFRHGLQYGRWDILVVMNQYGIGDILVVMKLKSPAGYRKEFLFQYDRWDFLVVKENL